jgi:hypothetical protein
LEVPVLRLVRIALLVSVSFVAGATMAGCNDDTTNTNANDMAVTTPGNDLSSTDLSGPKDLANHD